MSSAPVSWSRIGRQPIAPAPPVAAVTLRRTRLLLARHGVAGQVLDRALELRDAIVARLGQLERVVEHDARIDHDLVVVEVEVVAEVLLVLVLAEERVEVLLAHQGRGIRLRDDRVPDDECLVERSAFRQHDVVVVDVDLFVVHQWNLGRPFCCPMWRCGTPLAEPDVPIVCPLRTRCSARTLIVVRCP